MFSSPVFWVVVGFFAMIVVASFFEWTLHRYFMHKNVKWFSYPFKSHALVHHQLFKADHTYHVHKKEDEAEIPMAWWNGPAIIFGCCLPFIAGSLILGHWWMLLGGFVSATLYYIAYEYMHFCMHKPRERSVERNGIFFRLNGHHLLHHRYMHKNFNVVLPLADALTGTLLVRSKVSFAQARGPRVPDVQPLKKAA